MATTWLVQEDKKRDYSAAEEFGELKVVFSSIAREFDPAGAVAQARRVAQKMSEDDYLIMAGDPTLCAICVTAAVEELGAVNVLRWDRSALKYTSMIIDFDDQSS